MWIGIILGVLLLLFAAFWGAAWYFFRFSMVRRKTERDEADYDRDETSIWNPFQREMHRAQDWLRENVREHVKIRSFDGLELSALYIPSGLERPRGTVIAFHGYRSLATVDFAPEAPFFHDLGYEVLLPYQRSHGESQGKFITYGVKERFDCRDWARYAEKRFGRELPIFLCGISMGSSTVLMASELELPENVRGIVADCGFTSPWEIIGHVARRDYHIPVFPLLWMMDVIARKRAGFSLKEADTRKALEKSRLPVLFLHGKEDDFVPLSMTRENYAACRGKKELYLVEGAGHAQSFSRDPEGCGEKIKAFMDLALEHRS